ncbi:MAG: DUF1003 domain-containing protein [Bacilli bacterium]|nr:DUF1003 domain-containing protein [Bacilli bacterium]
MENRKTKKEIVKMLLNQNIQVENEDELIDLLLNEHLAVDVDKEDEVNAKLGDKVSDKLTSMAGSWRFIICFGLFLAVWIILNITVFDNVDPYPFILLNLLLSCLAAIQAPVIMMSQNRQSKKDSLRSRNDYKTDLKSELILEELHYQMDEILANQKKILKELEKNNIS